MPRRVCSLTTEIATLSITVGPISGWQHAHKTSVTREKEKTRRLGSGGSVFINFTRRGRLGAPNRPGQSEGGGEGQERRTRVIFPRRRCGLPAVFVAGEGLGVAQ